MQLLAIVNNSDPMKHGETWEITKVSPCLHESHIVQDILHVFILISVCTYGATTTYEYVCMKTKMIHKGDHKETDKTAERGKPRKPPVAFWDKIPSFLTPILHQLGSFTVDAIEALQVVQLNGT